MSNKICPLGLIARGAYSCQGKQCVLSDPAGNCLVKKYLETSIEEKDFALAEKKQKLDEQREKYLNATKMLN